MQKTILGIIWPYVLRYLAQRSADYLEERRERKRQLKEAVAARAAAPDQGGPETGEFPPSPDQARFSTANAVWYTLGGVLLGSAIGLILAKLLREES